MGHVCGLVFLTSVLITFNAQAAKTFVYCSEGSPSTFNPALATDGTTFNASSHTVYNRLVEFKKGRNERTTVSVVSVEAVA